MRGSFRSDSCGLQVSKMVRADYGIICQSPEHFQVFTLGDDISSLIIVLDALPQALRLI